MEEKRKRAILFAATLLCARTNVPPRGFMQSLARLKSPKPSGLANAQVGIPTLENIV